MKPKLIITDVAMDDINIPKPVKPSIPRTTSGTNFNLSLNLEIKVLMSGLFVDYFKDGKPDKDTLLKGIFYGDIEIVSVDKT